jgi:hypothetical protein
MITKERLEELIEKGVTIYEAKYGKINSISLKNKIRFISDKFSAIVFEPRPNEKYNHHKYFDKLFETLEEAEWHIEFGCIERTERLELPTWEEIQKYERFDFKDKYNHSYTLHYISGFKTLAISGWSTEYYAPATKENYTLACRKAKELFLGENK